MIRLLLALILFVVLLLHRNVYYDGNVYVRGNYSVHVSHAHDSTKTVRVLRDLRKRAIRLVDVLRKKYPNDERVKRLSRWNGIIHETEHKHTTNGVFGYNVNKGTGVSVCVHNSRGESNRSNDLFFVVMHEMSHIMTEAYEHDDAFWYSFRWLITEATTNGLFVNVDYKKHPSRFCDGHLMDNPTFVHKKND
jgi:hypothetical protein